MALRPDRIHIDSQIDFFMNEVAERGGPVCVSTVGSGAAMDQAEQLATYAANPSGTAVLGVLMCDVVNLDLIRQHENWHKEEVQKGGKVTIWSKGTVVTDRIYPGVTPTAGQVAYVAHSGYFANSKVVGDDSDAVAVVGKFLSTKDEDGFCKVSVNVP
jgi:hypothetical protein